MRVITEEEKLFLKSLVGKTVQVKVYYDNWLMEHDRVIIGVGSKYTSFHIDYAIGRVAELTLESLDVFKETGVFEKYKEGWSVIDGLKRLRVVRTDTL